MIGDQRITCLAGHRGLGSQRVFRVQFFSDLEFELL